MALWLYSCRDGISRLVATPLWEQCVSNFANRAHITALFGCYCVLHAVTVVIVSHRERDQLKLMFHINAAEDCHSLKMCGCYHDYHR